MEQHFFLQNAAGQLTLIRQELALSHLRVTNITRGQDKRLSDLAKMRHSVVVVHVTPSAMLDVPVYFKTF